ncbi:MAG: HEAT repeat domain-containing protein [Myxococcota bacterium]
MTTEQSDVQQFLNGLLITDQVTLRFLHQAVFNTSNTPPPEQAAIRLAQHVQEHSKSVPPALMRWLNSPSSMSVSVLAHLIRLAGFYQDVQIERPLHIILRQLTFVAAHPAAVRALAMARGPQASRVLTELLWRDPVHQWHVREPAILRELGRLGDPASIDDLLRVLAVDFIYEGSRRAAAEALAKFESNSVLDRLMRLARSTDNLSLTAGAAEALGLLGDARAVPTLQRTAQLKDARVAIEASVALARLGSTDAEKRLFHLAGSTNPTVREKALQAMAIAGQLGNQGPSTETVNTLMRGLEDAQPEVRQAASSSLGRLGLAEAAEPISRALENEVNPLIRAKMVRALGQLTQTRSLSTLIHTLRRDSNISVQVEALAALSMFSDPAIAEHIVPFRSHTDPKLIRAAERALRRLLYKPFAWPEPASVETAHTIELFNLQGARERFLPPPPPPPKPGFFSRLFGAQPPPPPTPPSPIGSLQLTPNGLTVELDPNRNTEGWQGGTLDWSRRFSVQITREPISDQSGRTEGPEDIGIHFVLRQRRGDIGADFETVAVSLWCAPSEVVGQFTAKSARLPCLDPHAAAPFLAALRWYAEIHGHPIRIPRSA